MPKTSELPLAASAASTDKLIGIVSGVTSQITKASLLAGEATVSRAAALSLSDTSGLTILAVYHGGVVCYYEKDATGTALTTADGQKWSPYGGDATPAHWGGLPGFTEDATTALQSCIDWVKTQFNTGHNDWDAWVNLTQQTWRVTSEIDVCLIRQEGFRFGNGTIFVDMTTGWGVQFFGSNQVRFVEPFAIETPRDPDACPKAALSFGRALVGANPTPVSPAHKGRIYLEGCASRANVIELGVEVSNLQYYITNNWCEGDDSSCLFVTGHIQDCQDQWGEVPTSPFCTVFGIADSPVSNILHDYRQVELKRLPHWTVNITGISLGATTTVSVSGATSQINRIANGQKVWITDAGGVTELEYAVYTLANVVIAGDSLSATFDLQGINSTGYTAYSSGGIVQRKTGPFLVCGVGNNYSFGPNCYGVSMGEQGIILHARNGFIIDFRWDGQLERSVKYPIGIDVGSATTAKNIRGLKVYLSNASQWFQSPFRIKGTNTLTITDLKLELPFSILSSFPLFTSGSNTTVINGDVRSPVPVDVTTNMGGFNGWVRNYGTPSERYYVDKDTYINVTAGRLILPITEVDNSISGVGDTTTRIRWPVAGDIIAFDADAKEVFRINDSGTNGRMGVMTTNPSYELHVDGTFGIAPGASLDPVNNGDLVFEFTNDTTITVKGKGSDGTIRSGTITLS